MNLSDELERLGKLRKDGVLSEQEFAQAKSKLLQANTPPDERDDYRGPDSLGEAANRYVTFRMVMTVISLIVFLIIFFSFFLPHFRAIDSAFPRFRPGTPFH